MTFHQPSAWFLLLLPLLPLLWWRHRRGRRRGALAFSSIAPAAAAGATWAVRARPLVPGLRAAALVGLIVCLARPQQGDEQARVRAEGIAIELVIDRSGSMNIMDFELAGRRATRLEAVRRVVTEFVAGGQVLRGRPDDLIGLVTFATWADSLAPLTLDHDFLLDAVEQTAVSPSREDQSTAIGDAIGLGVERLVSLQEHDQPGADRITSKVMVLLTDGQQNAGTLDPLEAAGMAAAFDIRIYTIAAGLDLGLRRVPVLDPVTGQASVRPMQVTIDEAALQEIARITGGKFFRAEDSRALEKVYAQIDELERTEFEHERYVDYREITVEPTRVAGITMPPLLCIVFVLLALEVLLANTRFRTLP